MSLKEAAAALEKRVALLSTVEILATPITEHYPALRTDVVPDAWEDGQFLSPSRIARRVGFLSSFTQLLA
jgi:hypothetical protein